MIITITQYFELININSTKLEDLWVNLLDVLCLERPNNYTVFKAVHHQGFRNIVLKDPLVRQIICEVEKFKDSGLAHMNPRKYLEQIYDIRRNRHTVEDPYRDLEEQGLFSESFKQLIEFLHDDIVSEMRPSGALMHHINLLTEENTVDSDIKSKFFSLQDGEGDICDL